MCKSKAADDGYWSLQYFGRIQSHPERREGFFFKKKKINSNLDKWSIWYDGNSSWVLCVMGVSVTDSRFIHFM